MIHAGLYNCQYSSTYFRVIKVHYQNGLKAKIKGAFVSKTNGAVLEVKNYTIQLQNVTHWNRIKEY